MEKLIPQVRFPEFTGEWEENKLGDVTNYVKGFAFKSEFYSDKGTRIVRVSDLSARTIKNTNDKIYVDNSEGYGKYKINKTDIIITTVGSKPELIESAVGRGIFVTNDNEGLLNQNLLKFNSSTVIDNGFIFGYINSDKYISHIKEIKRGNANQANITVADLLEYKVYIPLLPEQTKIANFISAVDEKLTALNQKKTLLEQYKKGVMQQIFTQELRFKDDNGNDYADWEEKKLGEVAEKRIVKNKDNKISLVFTNSAVQGIVNQRDFFDKDIANKNNLTGYYVIENDDFIYNPRISSTAPVGPISRNHLETGIMSPLYSAFRFKTGNLDFIEKFFASSMWFKHMEDISNYGARDDRMSFSTGDFYKMPIPFPSLPEQTKIANFLSAIDVKINHCQEQIDQATIWKKGLMQQMFV
ncbi:restriction endonuclease subunit S [Flavobacterium sp. 14A]|uniref:restriction endonuclease subunit S n=1 Tax=Flavobacterium sp. 14A TaxID=2735896 RepID=UPI00156E8EDA|nr:restriction endonuclease subunit S [Flavobacterium sp. 14A]NRT11282.1 type I restriction enzyme S subunit [Flavobacterium sp. 14A]